MTTETTTRVGGPRRSVTLTRRVLQVLLAAAFTLTGLLKLVGSQQVVDLFGDFSAGRWLRHVVGVLETAAAGDLMVPVRAAWAALGTAVHMTGVIVTNLLIGTGPAMSAVLLLMAGALVYLRRT